MDTTPDPAVTAPPLDAPEALPLSPGYTPLTSLQLLALKHAAHLVMVEARARLAERLAGESIVSVECDVGLVAIRAMQPLQQVLGELPLESAAVAGVLAVQCVLMAALTGDLRGLRQLRAAQAPPAPEPERS